MATEEKRRILGMRFSAIVETLLMLLVLFLVDRFATGGTSFSGINPNPYWIPVVFIAAQYGTNEGLFAALMTILVYFLGDLPDAVEGGSRWLIIGLNPVLWLLTAWLLGEVRQRHLRERHNLVQELAESHEREETISESYVFVRDRKENLEVQIAGKLTSSIEAYRAAKSVEALDPKAVLQGVEDLVRSVLNPRKFSLFLLDGNQLSASLLHGWQQSDTLAQEFGPQSPLYQAVVGSRQTLLAANEDHEAILDRQGVLAGPVINTATGETMGMLKIEQLDFVSLSLNTVETFKALCEWIGTALVNAQNYQIAKNESILNPEHNLYSYTYFKRHRDYLSSLAKRVGFDLTMIVVRVVDGASLDSNERAQLARQLADTVKRVLRSVDLAFDYQDSGEEYSILLPATNQAGANIVRDKIARELERDARGSRTSNFSFLVQALHAAN